MHLSDEIRWVRIPRLTAGRRCRNCYMLQHLRTNLTSRSMRRQHTPTGHSRTSTMLFSMWRHFRMRRVSTGTRSVLCTCDAVVLPLGSCKATARCITAQELRRRNYWKQKAGWLPRWYCRRCIVLWRIVKPAGDSSVVDHSWKSFSSPDRFMKIKLAALTSEMTPWDGELPPWAHELHLASGQRSGVLLLFPEVHDVYDSTQARDSSAKYCSKQFHRARVLHTSAKVSKLAYYEYTRIRDRWGRDLVRTGAKPQNHQADTTLDTTNCGPGSTARDPATRPMPVRRGPAPRLRRAARRLYNQSIFTIRVIVQCFTEFIWCQWDDEHYSCQWQNGPHSVATLMVPVKPRAVAESLPAPPTIHPHLLILGIAKPTLKHGTTATRNSNQHTNLQYTDCINSVASTVSVLHREFQLRAASQRGVPVQRAKTQNCGECPKPF
jgi:hypothetical protein